MQTIQEQGKYSLAWTIFQCAWIEFHKNATLLEVMFVYWDHFFSNAKLLRLTLVPHVKSLPRPCHENCETRHPQRFPCDSFLQIFRCDGGIIRGNMSMYTEICPYLGHLDSLSETLLTTTRNDWSLGMNSRVRMIQSALQNTGAIYVLFSSRRNPVPSWKWAMSSKSDLSQIVRMFEFWTSCLHVCSTRWHGGFTAVKRCYSSVIWVWNRAEWRELLTSHH